MYPTLNTKFDKAILHIDADAFFASCEQATHPEWRGKPVVTGKERGIVTAASYEAQAFGIKRGVPLHMVKTLCKDAIIVESDYETYTLFSKRMFSILRRFTGAIEEYSIDECFADITGLDKALKCSYETIAREIKDTMQNKLGINVSLGLASTKVLAKIASKLSKPSGLIVIYPEQVQTFLSKVAVENIWGVGPATAMHLNNLGIKTALGFAKKSKGYISTHFSKPQVEIWEELNGKNVYTINTEEKTGYVSISKMKTFVPASNDKEFIYAQLIKNVEQACIKARKYKLVAKRIIIILRTQTYKTKGLEVALPKPSAYPHEIINTVRKTFEKMFDDGTLYRATGIVLADLNAMGAVLQPTLFEKPEKVKIFTSIYLALDAILKKFGEESLHIFASIGARNKKDRIPATGLNKMMPFNLTHRSLRTPPSSI